MAELQNVGSIQIDEDRSFLEREWRAQRVGWLAIALVLLLACLGVFGHGPAAHEHTGDPAVFSADFDRVIRHGADERLTLHIGPGLQTDSIVRLYFASSYLTDFHVQSVQPVPMRAAAAGSYVAYDFLRRDARAPMQVMMQLQPTGYGRARARIQLGSAVRLEFSQLVLP